MRLPRPASWFDHLFRRKALDPFPSPCHQVQSEVRRWLEPYGFGWFTLRFDLKTQVITVHAKPGSSLGPRCKGQYVVKVPLDYRLQDPYSVYFQCRSILLLSIATVFDAEKELARGFSS